MRAKILSLDALEKELAKLRAAGRRIVLCHGVFDLLHPGHILHFKAARERGDVLVVTVTPDCYINKGPGRPTFPQRWRLESIAALEVVDFVALNEWPTAVETIQKLRPSVYAKGSEYANPSDDLTGKIVDERRAVEAYGGEVVFTSEVTFSSSNLINRHFTRFSPQTEQYLAEFRSRHPAKGVLDVFGRFSDLDVLVVGEAILDQYCYCHPLGKVPKETIIAARSISDENFAGGSLAIANHLAGFCRSVTLVTTLGVDTRWDDFIRSKLRPNVKLRAVRRPDVMMITKRRYVEATFLVKLFEIQAVPDAPLTPAAEADVLEILDEELPRHPFVLVADYGHGLLTERLRAAVCASNRFVAVNTQTNSANYGFNTATKYGRSDYICLHEGELKLSLRVQYGEIPELGRRLRDLTRARVLTVTRGPFGSLTILEDGSIIETPAFASRTVDRVGAGDAYFAITALCVYGKEPPDVVGFIGNCVGSLAVEIVCNREPIDPIALKKFIMATLA
ncbi:MAG TPA: PfkB family carbohydrate kinase [Planctomycetota bacterium]|nr:PfkB family carbohydrate kinase [Planctomycetota bacterium]